MALRLGEECGERNPGQLVCGCSNIGLSTVFVLVVVVFVVFVVVVFCFCC